jgi:DnaK suppressor protein
MKKEEMEPFLKQLLQLGWRLQGDVDALADETQHTTNGKAMGNLSNKPVEDRAELSSGNYDEEVTVGLLGGEELRLGEINDALDRINNGSFGCCEECGQEISHERLEAVPFARQCIDCARKAQQVRAASPGNL